MAESCTGGLLAKMLTDIPGSSAYFIAGVVSYANETKSNVLGVPKELLERYGAVSSQVAESMARQCRERNNTDWAISITGIAGPGGATPEKPVGRVVVAAAWARNEGIETRVRTFNFVGGREMVRFQASQAALDMVRRWVTESDHRE